MEYVHIPLALFDSEEYKALPWGDRRVLVDLYILFGDCETFTVRTKTPEEYRQPKGHGMARSLKRIVDCGLLIIDGCTKSGIFHYQRVFRFKYPSHQEYQKAVASESQKQAA